MTTSWARGAWIAVFAGLLACISMAGNAQAEATDLFISEYVEGSSFNKYLEIFNGTGGTADLSDYRLRLYANGASTPGNDVLLSGTLSNNAVVVYRNGSATNLTLPAGVTGIVNAAVNYNGDDAVALYKVSTGQNVDIFGCIGERPVTAWTSGAITTVDKTLRRKSSVTGGVTVNPGAGFPTLGTEWDQFDINTVDGLGSHTMDGGGPSSNAPPAIAAIGAQSVALGSNLTFDVVASDTVDGDEIVLTAEDLPAGAEFAAVTNVAAVTNTFVWTNASPAGVHDVRFLATDKDGTTTQTVSITVSAPTQPTLLISEYGEGSGFNKYIEIFNFGSNAVDLSQYTLKQQNGGVGIFKYDLPLNGSLPFNTAYVIVNSRADAALLAKANLTTTSLCLGFNGNDAIGLFQGGTLLDVVGRVDDPANWGADVTLVRRSFIKVPSVVYDPSEWDSYAQDYWDNVGFHIMDGLPPVANRPPVLTPTADRSITAGSNLAFNVVARDLADGDTISLWATDVPAGAVFIGATNAAVATGAFLWDHAGPTGLYTVTFHAGDKDGTNIDTIAITVTKAVSPNQSIVVHFNEVQPNDDGTDDSEFVELVAAAGTNLEGCVLVHYSGADSEDGGVWSSSFTFPSFVVTNSGAMDVEGNALGFVLLAQPSSTIANADFWLPVDPLSKTNPAASLRNGPHGLVLYDPQGEVLDAIAWPAWGMTTIGDIPVDDPGLILATTGDPRMPNYLHVLPPDPTKDEDLQAPNNVLGDPGSGWVGLSPTPGAINNNQISGQIIMLIPKPVRLTGPMLIVR